jgi:hypothetical protein
MGNLPERLVPGGIALDDKLGTFLNLDAPWKKEPGFGCRISTSPPAIAG